MRIPMTNEDNAIFLAKDEDGRFEAASMMEGDANDAIEMNVTEEHLANANFGAVAWVKYSVKNELRENCRRESILAFMVAGDKTDADIMFSAALMKKPWSAEDRRELAYVGFDLPDLIFCPL